jgi:uncharacterized heparinase superfamily protein
MTSPLNLTRLSRAMRLAATRLPSMGMLTVPDAPSLLARDPWAGDATRGGVLLRGEIELGGVVGRLATGVFGDDTAPPALRAAMHGFTWLRDLKALGTDAPRVLARNLVADWIATSALDPIAQRPDVAGSRLAAWLAHWEFFAASADDGFRRRLMQRLVDEARQLAARMPAEEMDGRALTALKGLMAVGVCLPDHPGLLARAQKLLPGELPRQFRADGSHVERSPMALLQALADLVEIRNCLQAAQVAPLPVLSQTIERAAASLRALRHGDGGLALFNASREGQPAAIDAVISQAARTGPVPMVQRDGGFYRLAAGRTVLIADFAPPAPPGLDRFAHAGTLSFELSVGKDRMIVNCGGAPTASGEWRDASRVTAAHSTLVVADTSSSELLADGLGRRPLAVTVQRHGEERDEQWLEGRHDGYSRPFGVFHHRMLYMSANGETVQGEDSLIGPEPRAFAVRFHLHPQVGVSLQSHGEAALLRLPSGGFWQLRARGGRMSVEESIYLGGPVPRRTEQVVITCWEDGERVVKWALMKQEEKPRA